MAAGPKGGATGYGIEVQRGWGKGSPRLSVSKVSRWFRSGLSRLGLEPETSPSLSHPSLVGRKSRIRAVEAAFGGAVIMCSSPPVSFHSGSTARSSSVFVCRMIQVTDEGPLPNSLFRTGSTDY
ncbi:hypothetical protein R1flu_026109 [Riccia fluitans]|uniref:Uncharacterized protein n=1 Tax=Riccia fluitans TaxID=41844 RepID=A0ABD1XF13_9MARC